MWMVFVAALAPVVALFAYVWFKDKRQPEPMKWLLKALLYGMLSCGIVLIVLSPFPEIEVTGQLAAYLKAFLQAAMPEEAAKLLMLWLLLRKNPYFDERLDGIVYASCVALGFAGLENIMYLLNGLADGSWVATAVSRAIFSVPGHFFFGTLMGYFFARAWFGSRSKRGYNMFMAWFVPMVAHGIYDGLLFSAQAVPDWMAGVLVVVFIIGFIILRRRSVKLIKELQQETNEDLDAKNESMLSDDFKNTFKN